jgi:hypothetical protein
MQDIEHEFAVAMLRELAEDIASRGSRVRKIHVSRGEGEGGWTAAFRSVTTDGGQPPITTLEIHVEPENPLLERNRK